MKICTKCGEVKQLNDYYKEARRPDGRMIRCKACINIRNKERRASMATTARPTRNPIVATYDDYIEIDVSTRLIPYARMKISKADWDKLQASPQYGRVFAFRGRNGRSYLYAGVNIKKDGGGYIRRAVHQLLNPKWNMTDHIALVGDATGLDNRRTNLRRTTYLMNANNRHDRVKECAK